MNKSLIILGVILVCMPALLLARRKTASTTTLQPVTRGKDCGQWTDGPCVPKNNGTCKGTMIKTRTGDNCPVKERSVKCKLPAPCVSARQANKLNKDPSSKGGRKAVCKYNNGPWSACDATTGTKTRTMTLKTGRRNANPSSDCEATKVVTKPCAAAKNNRG